MNEQRNAKNLLENIHGGANKTLSEYFDFLFGNEILRSFDEETEEIGQKLGAVQSRIKNTETGVARLSEKRFGLLKREPKNQKYIYEALEEQKDQTTHGLGNLSRLRDELQSTLKERAHRKRTFLEKREDISERIVGHVEAAMTSLERRHMETEKCAKEIEGAVVEFEKHVEGHKHKLGELSSILKELEELPDNKRALYTWKIEALKSSMREVRELLDQSLEEAARVRAKRDELREETETIRRHCSYWRNVASKYSSGVSTQ